MFAVRVLLALMIVLVAIGPLSAVSVSSVILFNPNHQRWLLSPQRCHRVPLVSSVAGVLRMAPVMLCRSPSYSFRARLPPPAMAIAARVGHTHGIGPAAVRCRGRAACSDRKGREAAVAYASEATSP